MISEIITHLDYFGTIIFAATGCLVAAKRQSDILAFILLGLITAVGGGTIRDLLIGRTPIFWLVEQRYIILCIVTAFVMFISLHNIKRIKHYDIFLIWADAIGLATFTAIGTHIAVIHGIAFFPAILLGVSTACFGGMLRDIISGETTLLFRNDIYMTACIIGSLTYILMANLYFEEIAIIASFIVTFFVRALAITCQLKLPGYRYFDNIKKGRH